MTATRFSTRERRCAHVGVLSNLAVVILVGSLLSPRYAAEIDTKQDAAQFSLPVDAIYVIGMKQCEERWKRVFEWAQRNNLTVTPLYGTHYGNIDMRNPSIPITGLNTDDVVMAGQVACTLSHIRVWRDAFLKNYSRIIVLEDDVRISKSLLSRLSNLLTSADQGSARRENKPWHYIYLRMHPTEFEERGEVWHQELRVAPPGWGTAAYVLSGAGIRYLLTRVTSYSYPLDVQLERLQRGSDTGGAHFVALDACGIDEVGDFPVGCPENIHELSAAEKGNCVFSGTQSGEGFFGHQMPGIASK